MNCLLAVMREAVSYFAMPMKPMKAMARVPAEMSEAKGRGRLDSAPGFSLSLQFIVKYINQ